ncbi:MAG: hypothetical protein QM539_10325, partial [Alphaproteobacteria bacterium]|nr:hypothetical protein [Alphaproteobacteria bacterium]
MSKSLVYFKDSFYVFGRNIKSLTLQNFHDTIALQLARKDSTIPNSFLDTTYIFTCPDSIKAGLYQLIFRDSNDMIDSVFRLLRVYRISPDSVAITGWGYPLSGAITIPDSVRDVVDISSGFAHTLILTTKGTVIGIGTNKYGVLNIPDTLKNVVAISTKYYHNLALLSNGKVVAWGAGMDSSIQQFTPNYRQSRVPDSVRHIMGIAAGGFHSLALDIKGKIYGWGAGDSNNLNDSLLNYGQSQAPDTNLGFTAITAGLYHSVAIKTDSTIRVWGTGLNDNLVHQDYGQRLKIDSLYKKVVAIDAGFFHTMVLRSDSTCLAFGDYGLGQTNVPGIDTNSKVLQIAAGGFLSSILRADSTVYQWGYGTRDIKQYNTFYGFIDNPDFGQALPPSSLKNKTVFISSGSYFNLAMQTLNLITTTNIGGSITPSQYILPHSNIRVTYTPPLGYLFDYLEINNIRFYDSQSTFTLYNILKPILFKVYFIPDTSCVIYNMNQSIYHAGDTILINGINLKTLETRKNIYDTEPIYLNYLSKTSTLEYDTIYKFLIPKFFQNLVYLVRGLNEYDTANRLYLFRVDNKPIDSLGITAWGRNWEGQLNTPDTLKNVVQIECGFYNNIALKYDGTCVSWSRNIYLETLQPPNLNKVVFIVAGGYHYLALRNDGTMYIWGLNDNRQQQIPMSAVYDNILMAAAIYNSEVQKANASFIGWADDFGVGSLSPPINNQIINFKGGGYHYLGLNKDSTLTGWGYNYYGQANIPSASGITKIKDFAAAEFNSLVLKPDSTIYAWGFDGYGFVSYKPNLNNVVKIATKSNHGLAIDNKERIYAWGNNNFGQTVVPKHLFGVLEASAGRNHTITHNRIYVYTEIDTNGTITPLTFLKYGDSFKITYQPKYSYKIDSVFINESRTYIRDSLLSYTFKNLKNYQVIEVKTAPIYDTIFTEVVNGTISPDTLIRFGNSFRVTYSTNSGFEIDSIFINGLYNANATNDSLYAYTFNNVTDDSYILVKFKRKTFRVSVLAQYGNIRAVNNTTPIATVYFDSNLQVKYTPNTGVLLDSIFINGRYDSMVTRDSINS